MREGLVDVSGGETWVPGEWDQHGAHYHDECQPEEDEEKPSDSVWDRLLERAGEVE